MNATRIEDIVIGLEIPGSDVPAIANDLLNIGLTDSSIMAVQPQDKFNFTYRFYASYFDDIESKLKAVLRILESGNITKATVTETRQAESIIMSIGILIGKIQNDNVFKEKTL